MACSECDRLQMIERHALRVQLADEQAFNHYTHCATEVTSELLALESWLDRAIEARKNATRARYEHRCEDAPQIVTFTFFL